MNRLEVVLLLQAAHDKYFRALMESYPGFERDAIFADFGPPEICELAIEAHACAIALGPTALRRLRQVGFDVLYPFDNPVDLYNWRKFVRSASVDHTIYASIGIRIDSEIKRIRRAHQLGSADYYDALDDNTFVVSKDRYGPLCLKESSDLGEPFASCSSASASIHVEHLHVNNLADKAAVSSLEKLEKTLLSVQTSRTS
jgi:hypothetical protein